jgi:hypothetical protein
LEKCDVGGQGFEVWIEMDDRGWVQNQVLGGHWFGTAPMAVHFWDLFYICDQVWVSVAEVWDGSEVKLSLRRNFSEARLQKWAGLVEKVSSIRYNNDDGDALVWQYESKGVYSCKSLYSIIT